MINMLNIWRTVMNQYKKMFTRAWVVIHKGRKINGDKHEKVFTLALIRVMQIKIMR